MRKLGVYVATIMAAGAILATALVVAAPALATVFESGSGQHDALDLDKIDQFAVRSEVEASDGTTLAVLHGVENREPVPLAQIPDKVKQAILAVEDAEFYNHAGVNVRALGRALLENVQAGQITQGGSTITQQLVKNVYLTSKQDLDRKTKEAALALRLEKVMTKDEILEAYLNTVYFGSGAYGVEAAAETYWGVHVQQLGWGEAAMLAAIISNPLAYDPTLHPEDAKVQRRLALDRLLELGFIDQTEHDASDNWVLPTQRCTAVALVKPSTCGDVQQPTADSYVADAVKNQLLDVDQHPEFDSALGKTKEERYAAVFGGGLRVKSTLDPVAQAAAQDAHDHTLSASAQAQANAEGVTNAMVSIESSTGAIRALIGGANWSQENQYNVALEDKGRPTGSTFKAFVLLTALEEGDIPADFVSGTGCWANPTGTPNPYCVSGVGGTITSITQASSNGAFVRLGQTVGLSNVVSMAERLGVTANPDFDPKAISMPLGPYDVSPLEMASAYSAIPNGGVRQKPYLIESIEDRFGKVLWTHSATPTRGFSVSTACYATQILEANVQGGTGTKAQLSGYPAAGKTGTTTANADVWFVGFTPQLTTAVWMGRPKSDVTIGNLGGSEQFGGLWPATIWHNYNQAYLDATTPQLPDFPTCAAPDRAGRPAAGAADPYGTLNGGSGGSSASATPRKPTDPGAQGDAPTDTSTTVAGAPDPNATPGGGGNGAAKGPN